MEVLEALEILKNNPTFKDWKKHNEETYFSYGFNVIEKEKENPWQLGFFDKKNDKLTSFTVLEHDIIISPQEDAFKPETMEIMPIEVEKVKKNLQEILQKAEGLQKKEYKAEIPMKIIAILQNLENFGTIWNITFVSRTMKTLNIKINSENGNILEHKLHSLFEFQSKK